MVKKIKTMTRKPNFKTIKLTWIISMWTYCAFLSVSCNNIKYSTKLTDIKYINLNAFCERNKINKNDTCNLQISITNLSTDTLFFENIHSISLNHVKNEKEIFGDHRYIEFNSVVSNLILYPNLPYSFNVFFSDSTNFFNSGLNRVYISLFITRNESTYVSLSNQFEIYFVE